MLLLCLLLTNAAVVSLSLVDKDCFVSLVVKVYSYVSFSCCQRLLLSVVGKFCSCVSLLLPKDALNTFLCLLLTKTILIN